MKKVVLLLTLLCFAAFADAPRAARVSVTTRPTGATLSFDGATRGQTPLMLFDVTPGRHHLRFTLPGYREKDVFVTTDEGQVVDFAEDLEEETGLLLLKTDPAGCKIRIDGVSVGETPRFVGNLSVKDTHTILLSKAGYQDQKISVRFQGREVVVREEKMVLDSGVLELKSEPSGAAVVVNGIRRGVTPLAVSGIPKGTAVVKIALEGYKDETREIRMNAGEKESLFLSLVALPGTMHLLSQPGGASFYVNDEPRGAAPITIANLKPGAYKVRCEKEGFGSIEKTITIENGGSVREEFVLSNVMGRIEVRTLPGGADVYLDGKKMGMTKVIGENEISSVFPIGNVPEGDHQLVVRKAGYLDVSRTVRVQSKKTAKHHRVTLKRAFIPNVEVETFDGVMRGVFKSQDEQAIVIEIKPGTTYPIPRNIVKKVDFLTVP